MKSILLTTLALTLSLSAFSQVKDIDGNEYKTVKIGEQEWMSENLNVTHFRNGDEIPQAKTAEEWKKAGQEGRPSWCYTNFDESNGMQYGILYNFYSISDSRGLAPEGWKIPKEDDWITLEKTAGDARNLKSKSGWSANGNGNNISGFNALPGGEITDNGENDEIWGGYTSWWSITEVDNETVWYFWIGPGSGFFYEEKGHGMHVRCIKD